MQTAPPTNTSETPAQYRAVIDRCKDLFRRKVADYGTSWRVLRPISITDQIYIKAWRIRQIQETGTQLVSDSVESEFIGIVNYGLIGLIQLELGAGDDFDLGEEAARQFMLDVERILVRVGQPAVQEVRGQTFAEEAQRPLEDDDDPHPEQGERHEPGEDVRRAGYHSAAVGDRCSRHIQAGQADRRRRSPVPPHVPTPADTSEPTANTVECGVACSRKLHSGP